MKKFVLAGLIWGGGIAVLSGCGGGTTTGSGYGTASGLSGTATRAGEVPPGTPAEKSPSARMGLFVTDGFSDAYDHVWTTVHKVELIDASEKAQTVFDDRDGITLDLARLHDDTGHRFELLTSAAVTPTRAHNRVRVTLGKAFVLFPSGASAGETTPVSDSIARDDEGRPQVTFALDRPRNLGTGKEDLVIDFDLSKFAVANGRVLPVLGEADKKGLADTARHETRAYAGVVSETAGKSPDQTFTLTVKPGLTMTVLASSATVFFNNSDKPSPTLTNGKTVTVRGAFASDTKRLVATQVCVGDAAISASKEVADDPANGGPTPVAGAFVRGAVSSAGGGTFVTGAGEVSGFLPTSAAVTVIVAPDATLRSRGGLLLTRDDFFKSLSGAGTSAEVEGSYDPITATLTARRVKIAAPTGATVHDIVLRGTPAVAEAAKGALKVKSLTEWDGMNAPTDGAAIAVATTAATTFADEKGASLTAAAFYHALADGEKTVRVTGLYGANGTVTATRAELRPADPKPETKPADTKEAKPAGEKPADPKATEPLGKAA